MIVNGYFSNRGGQNYEAPSVTILDIQSEGMLCASGYKWTEGGAGTYTEGVDIYNNGEY